MKVILALCLSLFSLTSLAVVNGHLYPFDNDVDKKRFEVLAEELRCPKCQNQNLSDSDAMIAGDLRRELYSQIKAGKQGPDIIEFMVKRYGEFVLYRPKLNDKTYVLWYGPMALGAFSFLIFIIFLLSHNTYSDDTLFKKSLRNFSNGNHYQFKKIKSQKIGLISREEIFMLDNQKLKDIDQEPFIN